MQGVFRALAVVGIYGFIVLVAAPRDAIAPATGCTHRRRFYVG